MKQPLYSLCMGAALLAVSCHPSAYVPGEHTIWFDEPCTAERTVWVQTEVPDYDGNTTEKVTLTFNQEWEQRSLPIGNGDFGANVMGSVATERLTLNEKSLWTGGPGVKMGPEYYWNVNKESYKLIPEVRCGETVRELQIAAGETVEFRL